MTPCDVEPWTLMKQKPKSSNLLENEEGLVIVACLMVMLLVHHPGSHGHSDVHVRPEGHDQQPDLQKILLRRGGPARAYVRSNSLLYGSDNITSLSVIFPDRSSPSLTENVISGENEAFNGTVEYLQSSVPPRGSRIRSGNSGRTLCDDMPGHGPREAVTTIEQVSIASDSDRNYRIQP